MIEPSTSETSPRDLGRLPETVMRCWRVAMLSTFQELQQSYALRYRVYCEERGFLPVAEYPDGVETDKFDPHALHFGSFDASGAMVGSARLVFPSRLGFPMFEHCSVEPFWRRKIELTPNLVEISRLVVSRCYRRRADDGFYGLDTLGGGSTRRAASGLRRDRFSVAVSLFKAMYQTARHLHVTHALSAMEWSLYRLLQRYHFPFDVIGPECDYFGPVAPFILDVRQTEERLATDCPDLLEEFNQGLYTDGQAQRLWSSVQSNRPSACAFKRARANPSELAATHTT